MAEDYGCCSVKVNWFLNFVETENEKRWRSCNGIEIVENQCPENTRILSFT